jgi:hypothetical protein
MSHHHVRRLALLTAAIYLGSTSGCAGADSTPAQTGGEAGATFEAGGLGEDAGATREAGVLADATAIGDDAAMADGGSSVDSPGSGDITPGIPITAPDGTWTRVDFPGGVCRSNQGTAHIAVRLNSKSSKFVIFMEGGGACFNTLTCLQNNNTEEYGQGQGLFNFSKADNPIADWNIFYVPYCSGDVHSGDNTTPATSAVGAQTFAGYLNMKAYLSRILATMSKATDELVAGDSAGGFGSGLLFDLIARNAPATVERFTFIDDSGPPMSSTYIEPCLQNQFVQTWGFENTILKDCGTGCPNHSDFTFAILKTVANKYSTINSKGQPRFAGGFISSTDDYQITVFYGFGQNNCNPQTNLLGVPVGLTQEQYTAGLLELRNYIGVLGGTDRFGTYFFDATTHTTLVRDQSDGTNGGLYDHNTGGVTLTQWMSNIINRTGAAGQLGP